MRKLKLQAQITTDGFVAGPQGQLDWMARLDADPEILARINHITDTSDTILLGRKMSGGFVKYWESVPRNSPEFDFAQKMVGLSKVVFSSSVTAVEGRNIRVENGPLVDSVNKLKAQSGKDIVVYGGATFVSSLLEHGLIDELNLFVNPVAIGDGLRIFKGRTALSLEGSIGYESGVVVNTYRPR